MTKKFIRPKMSRMCLFCSAGTWFVNLKIREDLEFSIFEYRMKHCFLKFLHKFYNKLDIPWVQLTWDSYYAQKIPHACDQVGSFWCKDMLKLTPPFRGVSKGNIFCGTTALFWKDLWAGQIIQDSHPRAFSHSLDEDVSVKDFLGSTSLREAFYLPLTPQALEEVRDMQIIASHLQPSTTASDVWHYSWGKANYKSTNYYKFVFKDVQVHQVFCWIWKSKCTMKLKVFAWLLFHDRLNTRNMLKRRHYNIGDDHNCLLCGLNIEETVEHMIFTCTFSKLCWAKLGLNWEPFLGRIQAVEDHRNSHPTPLFLEKFIVAAWSIWKERNNKHFRAITPSLTSWLDIFKRDFGLLQHRVNE